MIWLPLAIGGASCFGTSNFLGGHGARRGIRPDAAALVSHLVGAAFFLVATVVTGATGGIWAVAGLAVLGGIASALATVLLYRALRNGPMAVNAPVTGVTSIAVATVAGLAKGDPLTPLALLGIVAAIVAVAASSRSPGASEIVWPRGAGLPEAVAAGVLFGLFSLQLAISPGGAVETLLVVRCTSALLLAALVARHVRTIDRRATAAIGIRVGIVELSGNVLLSLALARGNLAVVQAIVSLNPVVTAVLAGIVYEERLTRLQYLGSAAALVSIPLLALGAG